MTWRLTRGQTDVNNNRSLWEPSATCLAPSWEACVFLYVLTTMIGDITSSGLRLRKPRHREVQTLTQEEWEIRDGGWRGHVSEQGSWWGLAVAAESQWPFPRPLNWLLLLLQWSSQGHLTLPLSSDHFLTTCCMSGTLLSPGHTWRQVHTGGKEPPGGGMKKPWQAQRWIPALEGCSVRLPGRQLISQAFPSQHFGDVQSLIYLWPVPPLKTRVSGMIHPWFELIAKAWSGP